MQSLHCLIFKAVWARVPAIGSQKIVSEICQRRQLAPHLTPNVSSVSVHRAGTRAIGSVTVWRTHLSKYVYQGRGTGHDRDVVLQCWLCRSRATGWRPQANCWSTICDTLHRTLHSLFTKCIFTRCKTAKQASVYIFQNQDVWAAAKSKPNLKAEVHICLSMSGKK